MCIYMFNYEWTVMCVYMFNYEWTVMCVYMFNYEWTGQENHHRLKTTCTVARCETAETVFLADCFWLLPDSLHSVIPNFEKLKPKLMLV
jgi:hypothetical protein